MALSHPLSRISPRIFQIAARVSLLLLVTSGAFAAEVAMPAKGSALRKALLDTLRPDVQSAIGGSVVFKVEEMRTDGEWAYVAAVPLRPSGERIDYAATALAQDVEEGFFDDWLCGLLRKDSGHWKVVDVSVGSTDAPQVSWPGRYGAPTDVVLGAP